MGYRAILESNPETVQDLEISAWRRMDEAVRLCFAKKHHIAIYLARLAAEMFLKTACFFVDGAQPADPVLPRLLALNPRKYKPPFQGDFESGHR